MYKYKTPIILSLYRKCNLAAPPLLLKQRKAAEPQRTTDKLATITPSRAQVIAVKLFHKVILPNETIQFKPNPNFFDSINTEPNDEIFCYDSALTYMERIDHTALFKHALYPDKGMQLVGAGADTPLMNIKAQNTSCTIL